MLSLFPICCASCVRISGLNPSAIELLSTTASQPIGCLRVAANDLRWCEEPCSPPAAYDLYLKGRYFWRKMKSDGIHSSLRYFTEALALDLGCAPACAGLADCYEQMGFRSGWNDEASLEALSKAKPLLERAVAMDNCLAEAYCTLGQLKSWYELDWAGADQGFRQALYLEPNNLAAPLWRSLLLSVMGRHEESVASVQRALESDPLSTIANTYLGVYSL